MKGKFQIKYVGLLLLLLLIVALLSVPRVRYRQTVAVEELASYPALEEAHRTLQEKYGDLITGIEIEILHIDSIWGSCDYYVLPCCRAEMNAVPQNGQAFWFASLHMVTACSDERNLTGKLFKLDVRNLRLDVETGEETNLSSRVEVSPGDIVCDMGEGARVELREKYDCDTDPAVRIKFLASTAMGTEAENQTVSGSFVWSYDLYAQEKLACKFRNVTLTQDYLVNAT